MTRWTDERIALLGHVAAVAATLLLALLALWATVSATRLMTHEFGSSLYYRKAN